MKRTYAIIGATGNVGSKVAHQLISKGQTVRVIARTAEKLKPFADKGAIVFPVNILDVDALTKALTGADAVFSVIAPDFTSTNVGAYQDQIGEATLKAVKKAGVKNIVFISSVGGHDTENTGIVAGLARQELRLKQLSGINTLTLRAGYYAENLLWNIGMIKGMGINGSSVKDDVKFPVIDTSDVAAVAADALLALDFKGHVTRPVLGARDYSYSEMTSIIGKAIGKNKLPYIVFPFEDSKKAMLDMGMSESVAQAMLDLQKAINIGIASQEKRDAEATTSTSFEKFVDEKFVPVFNS